MRYWLDTEFLEDGRTIDLLSIGIVAEDGRDHYFQSLDCDLSRANDWVRANVIPHLEHPQCYPERQFGMCERQDGPRCPWLHRDTIARELQRFCDPERYGKPEFWGYYADYDWVALCQLFGTMLHLPKGWPMYCRDLKQRADELGNPRLPEQGKGEHHALADAQWNRQAWQFLRSLTVPGVIAGGVIDAEAHQQTVHVLTCQQVLSLPCDCAVAAAALAAPH